MNIRRSLHQLSQRGGRMAGAALVVAGLLFGVAVRDAAASSPWAPELLTVEPVSPTSIRLTYKDRANDEEAINVIYGRDMAMNQRVEDLPGLPDLGRIATYTVEGLEPETTYCFQMQAWFWEDRGPFGIGGKRKVWSLIPSVTKCATTPAIAAPPPAPSGGDNKIALRPIGADLVPAEANAFTASIYAGQTVTLEAVVRQTGPASSKPVEIAIGARDAFTLEEAGFSGSSVVEKPAAFTCEGTATAVCRGVLTGEAKFLVQARATRAGKGLLEVTVDTRDAISERDETNNTKSWTWDVRG